MAKTIEQIQTLIDQQQLDPRQLINLVVDYLQENPIGGPASYLVYTALLTQEGTSAPLATVLQNTFVGDVIWTYGATGQYIGTLETTPTPGKFAIMASMAYPATTRISILDQENGSIRVRTYTDIGGVQTAANDILSNTVIELRIYP